MMDMEMNAGLGDDESESSQSSSEGSSASSTFCNLENDYARIIKEMKTNDALAAFETDYKRLFESLYKSHKNEKELMEKCNSLTNEIIENTQQINDLKKNIEIDSSEIVRLKQEIEKALKLADAAHTREQNAQEVIDNLRLNITKLVREIEVKNKQLAGEDDSGVSKQKETLLREKEKLLGEMTTLKGRLKNMSQYIEELEEKNIMADQKISEIQETLDIRTNEVSREKRVKEKVEEDFRRMENELLIKTEDLESTNETLKTATDNIKKLETMLKEQKLIDDKLQKELNRLTVKNLTIQANLDHANTQIDAMEKDIIDKEKIFKMTKNELNRTKGESAKNKSDKDILEKKFLRLNYEKSKFEQEMKQAIINLKNADHEITMYQKQQIEDKKQYEILTRDKNILARNNENLKEQIRAFEHDIMVHNVSRKKLEREFNNSIYREIELKKEIETIEKERDKCNFQVRELVEKIDDYVSEIKVKQVEILDYNKRLVESDSKYRQQQNLFEIVRAERNTCQKSLMVAHDDIQEFKSKLQLTTQQIEQLKEEISMKEADLIKKDFVLGRVEAEKETLKVDLQSARKDISDLRREIDKMKQEEKRLRQTIHEADRDIARHKKDIDNVMNERNILGTQLVRRNDELCLQYNRMKILNGTLQRGKQQYNERLEDIRLLKLEVNKLRTEKVLLMKSINNTSDMRYEIFHLNRNLTRERLKVMALEEEMQTPLNIHRWRKLEFSDPSSYEMLSKIQLLQKRVIKMSALIIDKEKRVQDTEKLYINLREIMAKQPGPQITMALNKTQKALRDRGNKMKCLVSELNMYEVEIKEYKFDIERMSKEMCELKTKYYAQKRKLQKAKENKSKSLTEPILPALPTKQKKFFGGGFNMTMPTPRSSSALDSA
ncbi:cilia- and flagella-associated protein 58-like [Vespa velutina]|uniref:cilia- and flagella-associated protein 58-like n=1 Tax=Vespa velutina TaxID=202808 RepID=UPI001FB50EA0|nr:cilia- and flagella-associated protein 58-like [Vespa velutina]XP_047351047.1 cilia- and flagella-associated protein 58-like [Vespa velutina]XP_047351048.1 cilia- and flagella-associated protein 58-like [Vespa velutina]